MTNINIVGGCLSDDASFDMWTTVQSRGSNWTKNEPPGWTAVQHGSLYSKDAVFNADSEYGTQKSQNRTST